jgi:hypothetical protein
MNVHFLEMRGTSLGVQRSEGTTSESGSIRLPNFNEAASDQEHLSVEFGDLSMDVDEA